MKSRTATPVNALRGALSAVDVALLQTLFDQAPDVAFFVKDAQGRYVAVNESLVMRHGIKHKSDVLGKRPRDICPADFAAALDEFEQELSKDVTATSLARRARLSPQRLARLTHRVFGLTPTQLITKTRIAKASRLLCETNKSVAEIAQATGFYDHSAFTRAFRSATGVTPTSYRNQA